jgi:hypothetical protein
VPRAVEPVIPPRACSKPRYFDRHIYRERHLVECFFNRIKLPARRHALREDRATLSRYSLHRLHPRLDGLKTRPSSPPSGEHSAATYIGAPAAVQCGSAGFVLAVSALPEHDRGRCDYQTGDRDSLASEGFRVFWRWRSRCRGGRPAIPREIRDSIEEMSRANWLLGTLRIHIAVAAAGYLPTSPTPVGGTRPR